MNDWMSNPLKLLVLLITLYCLFNESCCGIVCVCAADSINQVQWVYEKRKHLFNQMIWNENVGRRTKCSIIPMNIVMPKYRTVFRWNGLLINFPFSLKISKIFHFHFPTIFFAFKMPKNKRSFSLPPSVCFLFFTCSLSQQKTLKISSCGSSSRQAGTLIS